jgi:phospholipase C
MFATEFGGSFTAHLDLIAGTTHITPGLAEVNNPTEAPWGCDARPGTISILVDRERTISRTGPRPCFDQFQTLASTLDAAHVSWKYYMPAVDSGDAGGLFHSEFDAIKSVRFGPDWKRSIISPQTTILRDVADGKLPSLSWVIPDYLDSDHAGNHSKTGPSWVASVVNEIGESKYWNSTAIIILWDEWGGWYDNAAPPQLDFLGLGIRVPCIIVSPYAGKNYVSHTLYEYGSILKFAEQAFDLPPLGKGSFGSGYTDSRANSLADSFDFIQSPRAFEQIPAPYPASYFLLRAPSMQLPDSQ